MEEPLLFQVEVTGGEGCLQNHLEEGAQGFTPGTAEKCTPPRYLQGTGAGRCKRDNPGMVGGARLEGSCRFFPQDLFFQEAFLDQSFLP